MKEKDQNAQENFQIPEMPKMSDIPKIQEEQALSFEIAPSVKSPSTHALRDPAACSVNASGLTDANMNTSDLIRAMVSANPELNEGTFCTAQGGDPVTGTVGVYVVKETTPGAMPVRRNADGTYTLYLHNVFEKHPQLRPTGTRECAVTFRTDKDGKQCLVINLHGGLVKRTTARGNSGSSSGNGTAKSGS